MENKFKKLRFCRIFQSSFFSCRSKKLSDIIDKAISVPRRNRRNFRLIEDPFHNPKAETSVSSASHFIKTETFRPRRKVSEKFSPFLAPPASPTSPLRKAPLCEFRDCLSREKKKNFPEKMNQKKKKRKKKKKKRNMKNHIEEKSKEEKNFGGTWWYSSEDDDETEDETETLFSSRSLTSDSSVSRRRRRVRWSSQKGVLLPSQEKVRDSFAVVKNSVDPYKDFKASMVEMIIEKEIFEEKELEKLLKCFLSLNSHNYHGVILEAYIVIREALFFTSFSFGN